MIKEFVITALIVIIIFLLMPYGCTLQLHYLDKFNNYLEAKND